MNDVIDKSDAERFDYLRTDLKDDVWVSYQVGEDAIADLQSLFERSGGLRPECRFIVGPSNSGKSRILDAFVERSGAVNVRDANGATIPILYIQAPENPSIGGFFDQVIKGIDAPAISGSSAMLRKNTALRLCKKVGLRMLLIDEIQHLASGTSAHRNQCLNAIKAMSTELQIPIVAAGTEEAIDVIISLNQVENRFKPWMLEPWKAGHEFTKLMIYYEMLLPLRKASHLEDRNMCDLILRQSEGIFGEIYFLLRNAAEKAIQTGMERINQALLEELNYQGPRARTIALKNFQKTLREKIA
jgi:hypothetical protein